MPGAPIPQLLLEPIAAEAIDPANITKPMPLNPTGVAYEASIKKGFPPITMQDELAGGKPPLGQDMNGLWFLISSHTYYVQCGQLYLFDAGLASQIGGYLKGSILGMADGNGIWLCVTDGTQNDPDAGGAGWVALRAYGHGSVTSTGGTVTLSTAQARFGVIVITGALASNLIVNFPNVEQEWLVVNGTSGAFTTTLKTSAGSGVIIPQGGFSAPLGVYCVADGNIYPTVAPLGVPIDQAATPLTLVERTSAGYVLATYLNQNSGLEVPTVGAVFVQNSGADGFLRKIAPINFAAQITTSWLSGPAANAQIPFSAVSQWAAALFTSPANTGTPTAPTASVGTNTTQLATTAFVQQAVPGFKIAWGRVVSAGLQSGSRGVTGVAHPSTGTYTLDLTAAGFTTIPTVVPAGRSIIFDTTAVTANATSATSCTVTTFVENVGLSDRDFQFVAFGN